MKLFIKSARKVTQQEVRILNL